MTRPSAGVRIVDVDFARKSARIEVSPSAVLDADRLQRTTRACRARGLTPIVAVGNGIAGGTPTWSCRSIGAHGDGVEYSIRVDHVADMLERVTTALILIGEACDLDEVMRKHLRFCVYELAVNTIEHGLFAGVEPEVRIMVRLEGTEVRVTYRDNSHKFATDAPRNIDVITKTANGDRRGFGLFLMQELAQVEYERVDCWNTTTLTLAARSRNGNALKRSAAMEGVTIEIIPCRVKDTAVIKLIGSVDSSTAESIEVQVQNLVSQGSRQLVFDFSDLDFISSAGIGILLGTAVQLRGAGGDLVLMHVPHHVEELFEIINVKSFFTVVGSLDELQAMER